MKQVTSILLVAIGSLALATLMFLVLAKAVGVHTVEVLSGNPHIPLAGATIVCFSAGALLSKDWPITFGEVWVVGGAFLLGVAVRSEPAEAELIGLCGLLSFIVGYVVLRRMSNRRRVQGDANPNDRELAIHRMLEDWESATRPPNGAEEGIAPRKFSLQEE